jgi:hypothetical protein
MSCLPDYKPQKHDESAVLSEGMIHVLSYYLPATCKLLDWKLLYSPKKHGSSLHTFLDKVEEWSPTLMVIRDTFGHVFGCFMTEEWHFCSTFYGTQEAFVFTFHKGEDLRISAATEEGTAI